MQVEPFAPWCVHHGTYSATRPTSLSGENDDVEHLCHRIGDMINAVGLTIIVIRTLIGYFIGKERNEIMAVLKAKA